MEGLPIHLLENEEIVLILILVEVALGDSANTSAYKKDVIVLILILVEVALGVRKTSFVSLRIKWS